MPHWVERLAGGGPHRSFHAAVASGDRVFSFGGWEFSCGDKTLSGGALTPGQMDVHVFNTVSLRWRKLPPAVRGECPGVEAPSRRCYHTAVLVGDAVVYVWGGYTNTKWSYSDELYAFNVETHRWRKPAVSGAAPRAMKGHSACAVGNVMYVYGTWNQWSAAYRDFVAHTDVYKLDTVVMVWSRVNAGGGAPPVSEFHSATVIGTKMFVFGGCRNQESYRKEEGCHGDVRVFDTEADRWLSTPPPARPGPDGRTDHAAFAHNGELYVFGGRTWEHVIFDDLWKFSPESLSWKRLQPKEIKRRPSARYGMGCCVVGDGGRAVLFGGDCDDAAFDDLYVLDLSPGLKTLCKLAVIKWGLEYSGLPHDIRWEFRCAQRQLNDFYTFENV